MNIPCGKLRSPYLNKAHDKPQDDAVHEICAVLSVCIFTISLL